MNLLLQGILSPLQSVDLVSDMLQQLVQLSVLSLNIGLFVVGLLKHVLIGVSRTFEALVLILHLFELQGPDTDLDNREDAYFFLDFDAFLRLLFPYLVGFLLFDDLLSLHSELGCLIFVSLGRALKVFESLILLVQEQVVLLESGLELLSTQKVILILPLLLDGLQLLLVVFQC